MGLTVIEKSQITELITTDNSMLYMTPSIVHSLLGRVYVYTLMTNGSYSHLSVTLRYIPPVASKSRK